MCKAAGGRERVADEEMLYERAWQRRLTRLALSGEGQPPQALLSPDAPALRQPIAREWVQPRWKIEIADGSADVTVEFDENGIGRVANP